MNMIGAIRNRRQGQRGHLALLLGLPATVITIVAMTVAPAGAATGPGAKASAPTAHKSVSRAATDNICILELEGLTPSATTVPVGASVNLSAATSCDIGPTPYYLQIFDVTTGTLVHPGWGGGTNWSQAVSQNVATTHGYVAYLDSGDGSAIPTTGIYAKSATIYVTWEAPANNLTVTLTGPAEVGYDQGPAWYTATTNQDLRNTPYYLEIFDETTGTELTANPCGVGTTCSVSFTPSFGGDNLVAFVSDYSSALPPVETQASSNVLNTFQLPNIG